jgi:hypothetical protein
MGSGGRAESSAKIHYAIPWRNAMRRCAIFSFAERT